MSTHQRKNVSFPHNSNIELHLDFESIKNVLSMISNGAVITDENVKILFVNSAFTKITGYTAKEVMGDSPGILHSGKQDKNFYKKMWRELLAENYWQGEIWNRNKSGTIYPELLTITRIKNKNGESYYISIFNDITFLKKDEAKKYHLAFYDPLTLLPNRNLLKEKFDTLLKAMSETQTESTLLFIDLDKFKLINDNYGHVVGDQLLQCVAKIMTACTKESDTVSRFGGDEFVILLPGINTEKKVIDFHLRLIERLSKKIIIDEFEIECRLSVGACFFPKQSNEFNDIIKKADEAMYKAKKNHVGLCIYEK